MKNSKAPKGKAPWEDFDNDLNDDNTSVASADQQLAVEEALGLQMISIRLQRDLISSLKFIADHHKIGYQPLIRDLLNRFARSELQNILHERLSAAAEKEAGVTAVDDFIEREGARKRA